jgi:hypothetical protein
VRSTSHARQANWSRRPADREPALDLFSVTTV